MSIGTYKYKSEFARRYFSEGKEKGIAKGKLEEAAKLLLVVLHERGIRVTKKAEARINECQDLGQLETWIFHAASANNLAEVRIS
ncbi:hypothetical protein [Nocardia arthritidis]|uniref:Uncharacterized protein n=1 Tax=Nocardia arthritidis TaxID=228602 RepID=A0A6G9YRQ6_9NOCA|nr:hypothetical protein [Nocardia arthritidis]QIS15902.1 hypothetical protein F5544_40430 [Nocardia arthritidis]